MQRVNYSQLLWLQIADSDTPDQNNPQNVFFIFFPPPFSSFPPNLNLAARQLLSKKKNKIPDGFWHVLNAIINVKALFYFILNS